MKFISKLSLLLIFSSLFISAKAQNLGKAIVVNPYPPTEFQTFLATVTVAWEFNLITLIEEDTTVPININGKTFNVSCEVYFDPEVAWDLGQTLEDPLWGNELVIDFSEIAFEEGYPKGSYTINIPEGIVKDVKGNTNSSQLISFIKVDVADPTEVTPADGMYAPEALTDVKITFDDRIAFVEESDLNITARKKNDWLNPAIEIEKSHISINENGNSLNLDLSYLPTGILYSINIPEGFLVVGDGEINSQIWMEYMLWDGMGEAKIISAPEHESSPSLKPFILTWDYEPIKMVENAPATEFVCGYPDYGLQDGWRIEISASDYDLITIDKDGNIIENNGSEETNAVYLDVAQFTANYAGYDFEIFFPEGLVVNHEGLKNPPFSYKFTIREVWGEPEITGEGSSFNIFWKDADWVTYNLSDKDPILKDENGKTYELQFTYGYTQAGEVSLYNEEEHGLTIDLSEMDIQNGKYTITIPQGYILINGLHGENILNGTVTFSFSWEDGEISDLNNVNQIKLLKDKAIYDLKGRKIKNDSDCSDIKPGIYIINGKKRVIK